MKTTKIIISIIALLSSAIGSILLSASTERMEIYSSENPVHTFWERMNALCGNTYRGTITQAPDMERFKDWNQIMHVYSCKENRISIRFVEDRLPINMLRIITLHEDDRLELRHDYRNLDGSPAMFTGHGGYTTNPGSNYAQIFPADFQMIETVSDIGESPWEIVWRIEIHPGKRFIYFNQRVGTMEGYQFEFDLSKTVEAPPLWGWEETGI